jgi:ectoine hydroxylase-related dioxygenase (phytanoyl-CoA dioxygenase family)
MTEDRPSPPSEDEIAAYRRDGAVCLRGLFRDWVAALREGVARNIADPGPVATEHRVDDGRFFEDYCNWQRIPEYRDFVLDSPAAEAAARLMGARRVQVFHEHVLVKEPGTAKATPWHHDMPYYCVEGGQTASLWLALDPVSAEVSPEFVAGSHLWGRLFYPRLFDDGSDYAFGGGGYETVPDIEAEREAHRILSWPLEPGDAVAFNFMTLHAAPGNPGQGRRRGFATRWLGDDVRFVKRPGKTSPPYPGIGLEDGQPLREDWFPVVWRADNPANPPDSERKSTNSE